MGTAETTKRAASKKSTETKGGKPKKVLTKKTDSKKVTTPKKAVTKKTATPKRAATPKKDTKKVSKKETKKDTKKVSKKDTKKDAKKDTKKTKAVTPKKSRAATPKKDAKKDAKKTKAVTPKKSRAATPKKATPKKTKGSKVEKDDLAIVIADVEDNIEKLLTDHVSKELLVELLECNSVKIAKSNNKEKIVKAILAESLSRGENVVRDRVSKATLAEVVGELKGEDANAPNNKGELQKEFKDLVASNGGFIAALKKLKTQTVDLICGDLGFTEAGDATEKVNGLLEETTLLGVRYLFDRSNYNFMKEIVHKAGLSTKGQREHLVSRFLGQAHRPWLEDARVPEKEKKEKKEKGPGPNVEDIKDGITDLELYQYSVKDLEGYIAEKELRKGSNKKEMIKTILGFLKGDESVLAANTPKKVAGKRKRDESDAPNKKQKTEESSTA